MEKPAAQTTAIVAVTPDNLIAARAAVAAWPELDALIAGLREQGLFPGLRALQFRLSGAPEWVAQGLAAIAPQNAPAPEKTAQAGQE